LLINYKTKLQCERHEVIPALDRST